MDGCRKERGETYCEWQGRIEMTEERVFGLSEGRLL